MSILEQVKEALDSTDIDEELFLQEALADAERMSDQFSEVKPIPYIVPIERFAGLPVFNGSKGLR